MNQETSNTLNIVFQGQILKHNNNPKYLGIMLGRTLTYKQPLTNVAGKLRTRNILIKLADTTWGRQCKHNSYNCSGPGVCTQ